MSCAITYAVSAALMDTVLVSLRATLKDLEEDKYVRTHSHGPHSTPAHTHTVGLLQLDV